MSERKKVYQLVLMEIQRLIKEDGYVPGDKLPSERQLSIQFDAARSSVREALRAIELLGIIETRQGEGTFLRNYQTYHAVEVLASFVLQDSRTKNELQEAQKVLEQHVLSEESIPDHTLKQLEALVDDLSLTKEEKHHYFFSGLFEANGNQLLFKMWRLMQDFQANMELKVSPDYYEDIIEKYKKPQE
ncbi:FadR/GntR family transcriptional regulator [Gracilibacillus kekensis]|uniref:Transcriptional regulator, GntR family n=1 Tax=Gracilibacillus kekensis TaxID=1027249 RepID=A0A1M7NPL1_9BACI|nr:GntR family transcriptional regulator [Gracilibacillus kekensis]SHN05923.1 transcriptional regulator, GntR family [Gracilibacillus kekensis]